MLEIEMLIFELHLCEIELFKIELFSKLTVCKQKLYLNKWLCVNKILCTYAKLNCLKLSETIYLCAKKWAQAFLKCYLQNVFRNYIFNIYV